MSSDLLSFYERARKYVLDSPYRVEVEWCRERRSFEETSPRDFFSEYVYVVLNAGMREQVARKIFERFWATLDSSVIGHLGKRQAVEVALQRYNEWFEELKKAPDKIEFLETLPWIGPITKYHLARNIGIDTVKPDRHLVRLAERFGYESPLKMCVDIQKVTGERLGVIDVILWRYCNLTGASKQSGQSRLDSLPLEAV